MRFRLQPWLLVITLMGICGIILGGIYWYRARVEWTAAAMASYLPRSNATIAYVDVEKLREAGLLDLISGSKAVEDLDYKQFVDQTGFDYKTDLDRVSISFQGDNRFVLARGKFDWKKLEHYLVSSGGSCHNAVCNYQYPEPLGRKVSYYPIRPNLIGLYSGTTEWGVYDLAPRQTQDLGIPVPDAPLWISVPSSQWSAAKDLPVGTKAFASVFGEAEQVMFSVDANSSKALKLYADVMCATDADAAKLQARLAEATDLLKKMMAREHQQPRANDLSGLLAGGTFILEPRHVKAAWPLDRALLEALASGRVN